MENLIAGIENRSAVVGVIGLGYVGLPVSVAFARRYRVVGFDTDIGLVNDLSSGQSPIEDVTSIRLKSVLGEFFKPTSNPDELRDCNFFIISVPTPLTESKEPDLSHVREASRLVRDILQHGQFVILESTTYPGTTDEVVVPIHVFREGSRIHITQARVICEKQQGVGTLQSVSESPFRFE